MKTVFVLILLILSPDPVEIARINKLKEKAKEAYKSGDYQLAAETYKYLYDSMNVAEDQIALNLGHSYFALGDSANARLNYQNVASGTDKKLKSIAYQQLGVMADNPQTLNESLQYLKAALKSDPTNEQARYNYEVVKKKIEEQKKQQQDQQDQNQDQQNKDQQKKDQNKDQQKQDQQDQQQDKGEKNEDQDQQQKEQEQKGDQGEQSEEEKEQQQGEENEQKKDDKSQNLNTKERLEEMNISEEKAQMILEAMKNNEIQYIQQQKRKPTKQPDSGKPDW